MRGTGPADEFTSNCGGLQAAVTWYSWCRMTAQPTTPPLRSLRLLIVIAACFSLPACGKLLRSNRVTEPAGVTVVYNSISRQVNPDLLAGMRWQDIAPTAESCVRHDLANETFTASEGILTPQVLYLRGLLRFSLGDETGSTREWSQLDRNAIPAGYWHVRRIKLPFAAEGVNRIVAVPCATAEDGDFECMAVAKE